MTSYRQRVLALISGASICDRIRSAGLLNLLESCTGTERKHWADSLDDSHLSPAGYRSRISHSQLVMVHTARLLAT